MPAYQSARRWQHIPIILVTALGGEQDLARGLDAGADDFISKPVSGLELRARVRSMLRIKNQYELLQEQQRELKASLAVNEELAGVIAQRVGELESLHGVGLRLMGTLNVDQVVETVSQTALELVPQAKHCVMHVMSDDKCHLLPVAFSIGGERNTHLQTGTEEIVSEAIETRKIIYVPDLAGDPRFSAPPPYEMRALLVVPLIVDEQPIGTLSMDSPHVDAFELADRRIVSILASQAAVAIGGARLFEALERGNDREERFIHGLFQRYVSPAVVERLVEDRKALILGGKRQQITVLFADIRGFTAFSENLSPERLIEVLNQYLALAIGPILVEQGTLNKFMGDAVMALFNVPLSQDDRAARAVRAALAVQRPVCKYSCSKELDQPCLSFGVGIHTGQAVVGNIGTVELMNYTAIGDTVNLAKRLQENAAPGQIVLSHDTYEAVQDIVRVEDLGPLAVKGRAVSEHAYSLIDLVESQLHSAHIGR